jgi:hypothetical protein
MVCWLCLDRWQPLFPIYECFRVPPERLSCVSAKEYVRVTFIPRRSMCTIILSTFDHLNIDCFYFALPRSLPFPDGIAARTKESLLSRISWSWGSLLFLGNRDTRPRRIDSSDRFACAHRGLCPTTEPGTNVAWHAPSRSENHLLRGKVQNRGP